MQKLVGFKYEIEILCSLCLKKYLSNEQKKIDWTCAEGFQMRMIN